MFLWKMSSKSVTQTDFLVSPGPLLWWGKNATSHEVISTYFHLVRTCVAEKISDFENASIIERQRKISVPKSLLSQSSLNIKGGKQPSFIYMV